MAELSAIPRSIWEFGILGTSVDFARYMLYYPMQSCSKREKRRGIYINDVSPDVHMNIKLLAIAEAK